MQFGRLGTSVMSTQMTGVQNPNIIFRLVLGNSEATSKFQKGQNELQNEAILRPKKARLRWGFTFASLQVRSMPYANISYVSQASFGARV